MPASVEAWTFAIHVGTASRCWLNAGSRHFTGGSRKKVGQVDLSNPDEIFAAMFTECVITG